MIATHPRRAFYTYRIRGRSFSSDQSAFQVHFAKSSVIICTELQTRLYTTRSKPCPKRPCIPPCSWSQIRIPFWTKARLLFAGESCTIASGYTAEMSRTMGRTAPRGRPSVLALTYGSLPTSATALSSSFATRTITQDTSPGSLTRPIHWRHVR